MLPFDVALNVDEVVVVAIDVYVDRLLLAMMLHSMLLVLLVLLLLLLVLF